MNRTRIRDLALVALAGGLLTFEVTSLRGAAPLAMRSLTEQGVVGDVQKASTDAAVAAAAVVSKMSRATALAAAGTIKQVARLIGTVKPASDPDAMTLFAYADDVPAAFALPAERVNVRVATTKLACVEAKAVRAANVRIMTISKQTCRQLHAQRAELRRLRDLRRVRKASTEVLALRELRREVSTARRGNAL
jgi:hypothetical protein